MNNQFSLKTRSLSPNVLLGLFQSWEQTKRNTARLSNGLSRKWEEELWSLYGINGIGALNFFPLWPFSPVQQTASGDSRLTVL